MTEGDCTTEFFRPFFSYYRELVALVNITTCTIISCHITPSGYLNGFLCRGARKTLRCSLRSYPFAPNIVNHWVRKNLYASTEGVPNSLIHFKFGFGDRFVNRFHGRLLVLSSHCGSHITVIPSSNLILYVRTSEKKLNSFSCYTFSNSYTLHWTNRAI